MIVLALEPGIAGIPALLTAAEEILERRIQRAERRLERGGIRFTEPRQLFLQASELLGAFHIIQRLAGFLEDLLTAVEKMIPDEAAAAESLLQLEALGRMWVQSEFVGFLHDYTDFCFSIYFLTAASGEPPTVETK